MSNNAYKSPVAPFWPLGKFTVTSGTPVSLNTNVGTQTQGSAFNLQMSRKIKGVVVSVPSANTGDIFLMKSGGQQPLFVAVHPYTDTNCVVAICPKGQTTQIPSAALSSAGFTVDDLAIDSANTNDVCYVTAIRD